MVFKSVFMHFKQLAYTNRAPFEHPALVSHIHHTRIPEPRVDFRSNQDGIRDVATETGLLTT